MPKSSLTHVIPWTAHQVFGVRAALPEHLRATVDVASGCGLRQGEVFGLSEDELDHEGGRLAVGHQLKRIRGKFVFALPKGGKDRDVPLPSTVADALKTHSKEHPPIRVTLPWRTPDGPLVTKSLLFTDSAGSHVRVSYFNDFMWKPALAAVGIIPEPEEGPVRCQETGNSATASGGDEQSQDPSPLATWKAGSHQRPARRQ
ncbi:hypothetical protein [Streptomyces sp. NPDC051286]|uniref:hypothetical protein n=1 Tax=Streptomyces sp. NPDC051286 TaxID=3365647 RepID=UPI0037BC0DE8